MSSSNPSTAAAGSEFTVDSSDVIRLILGYLTSQGLHQSAQHLRRESGIGFSRTSIGVASHSSFLAQIRQGEWGQVFKVLQLSQDTSFPTIPEQVILELAETDEGLPMAYSLLKLHRDDLDQLEAEDSPDENSTWSKARSLEQRLAALSADPKRYSVHSSERWTLLYGSPDRSAKQARREKLAQEFQNHTAVPLQRLPVLLQQACKWQAYSGQLPWVKESLSDETSTKKKKKKKRKHLDLVLGTAAGDREAIVGEAIPDEDNNNNNDDEDPSTEPIASEYVSKVKFGKSAVCQVALFGSQNGLGLITASSDGLIELWDASFQSLNTEQFPYQKDSVMGHDDPILSMALSKDESLLATGDSKGTVKVWKLASGQCLRSYQAHGGPISCLDWARDASRILSASSDGSCREVGVVGSRVLQDYPKESSYILSCQYVWEYPHTPHSYHPGRESTAAAASPVSWVVVGYADGTARLWQKGQCLALWQPDPAGLSLGASVMTEPSRLSLEAPSMGLIITIPHPNCLVLVPRGPTAYLVNFSGTVLQRYEVEPKTRKSTSTKTEDTIPTVFCAGTASHSWLYLCTNEGDCHVYRLKITTDRPTKSKESTLPHTTIRDFGLDSTSRKADHSQTALEAEVSQIVHHPYKSIVGAFSSDRNQKKGILAIWK